MTPAADGGGDPCGDISGKRVLIPFADDMKRLVGAHREGTTENGGGAHRTDGHRLHDNPRNEFPDPQRLLDGKLIEAVHPPAACADRNRAAFIGNPDRRLGIQYLFDADEDSQVVPPCRFCDQAGSLFRRLIVTHFRASGREPPSRPP